MIYKKHKWEKWINEMDRCCQCGLLRERHKVKGVNGAILFKDIRYRGYKTSRSTTPTLSTNSYNFVCDDFRLKENENGNGVDK